MQILSTIIKRNELRFLFSLQRAFPAADIYLVGGIVRDTLLGRRSKDYDFVIRNVSLAKLQGWLGKRGQVDLVGRRFGVLKFIPAKTKLTQPIDIALPRTEHAWGTGGYRDVQVQSNARLPIADDLSRRDFTINALAYNVTTGEFIDEWNGQSDLEKGVIRTVGAPTTRFQEDYSRMLRAMRFSCQLGFGIEPLTKKALISQMRHISDEVRGEYTVPREIIASELTKAFMAHPVRAFDLTDELGITRHLMPEMLAMKKCPQPRAFHAEGDVWTHTRLCLEKLYSPSFEKKFAGQSLTPELVFALLWHDIGKPATLTRADRLRFNNHDVVGADLAADIMDRLRLSSAGMNTDHVVWLIRKHMIVASSKSSPMKRTTIEKYFYSDNPGTELLMLSYADILATIIQKTKKPATADFRALEKQIVAMKPKRGTALPPPLLSGNEIMRIRQIKPGPRVGRYKEKLREAQLRGRITTKTEAQKLLKNMA